MVADDGRQSSSVLPTPCSLSHSLSVSYTLLGAKSPIHFRKTHSLYAHVQHRQRRSFSHLDTDHHSHSPRHENRTCRLSRWFSLNHTSLNLGPVSHKQYLDWDLLCPLTADGVGWSFSWVLLNVTQYWLHVSLDFDLKLTWSLASSPSFVSFFFFFHLSLFFFPPSFLLYFSSP